MKRNTGVVVVGVDNSPGARAALDFALEEGIARGATVEIITAWVWSSPYEGIEKASTVEEAHAAALAMQDQVVQAALDWLPTRPVIAQSIVHEYAGKELVKRSESALMLIVGSGRKGPMSRALIGSVSQYCARHAAAPVLVVPDPIRVEHTPHTDIAETISAASQS